MNIGNVTVWNGSSSGNASSTINNSQLSSLLNYNLISNKTIPIRFGSKNLSLFGNLSTGNADVILITDISGSMSGTIGGSGSSVIRNCSDPLLYNPNTQKLSLAKCLDETFVYTVLSGSNNRVGLVSFSDSANNYINLTTNVALLNSTIQGYALAGATCVSCAINRAYLLLQANSNSSRQKYVIVMTDGVTNQRSTSACYDLQGSGNDPLSSIQGVVGASGPEAQYAMGLWSTPASFGSAQLYNIDFLNNTAGFAVGSSYQIYKWNGAAWSLQNDLGSQGLFGVDIFNASLGFAVGDSGKIFKWNGSNTNWNEYQDIGNENLKGLDFLNRTYGITVGDSGDIYEWNGRNWSLQQTIPYSLTDVDIFNSTLVFASSSNNNLYKKIGPSSWSGGIYTSGGALNTISIFNATYGIAGGIAAEGIIVWNGAVWNKTYPWFYYEGNSTTGLSCTDADACSQYQTAPMLNANYSSCRVNRGQNAIVHSIGFGSVATCGFAAKTLLAVASCGNGSYYASDNATQLQQIYQNISQNILQLSYAQQTAQIIGNASGTLYADSYIQLNYVNPQNPFGLILSVEKQFQNSTTGNFSLYPNSTLLDAKVTSYSGSKWTEKVSINNNLAYNINYYGSSYISLGDPYSILIPNQLIQNQNYVSLSTAVSPTNVSSGSQYNKIIYTLAKNFTTFSQIAAVAQGCNWNIQFEDGTSLNATIPSSYSGPNNCYFPAPFGFLTHDPNDAYQVAVFNLLQQMDLDSNNKIDIKFAQQALQIELSQITGIPYTWYTEVQVRVWS